MIKTPTFQYTLKTTAQIERAQKRLTLAWGIGLAVVLGLGVASEGIIAIPVLCFMFSTVLILAWVLIGEEALTPNCSWMPSEKCAELLECCKWNSDLAEYRNQVLAEGRMFTMGEYLAMTEWPEEKNKELRRIKKEQAKTNACKALYGQATAKGDEHVA